MTILNMNDLSDIPETLKKELNLLSKNEVCNE